MNATTTNNIDRLPPHSIEAEQGILGCVLQAPESMDECGEKLKAGERCFYDARNQMIYALLVEMHADRSAIDLITVRQRLMDRNQLEEVGGLAYLSLLVDSIPSAANLEYYLEIAREKHLLRELIRTGTNIVASAFENSSESVDALLDSAQSKILEISDSRSDTGETPIKVFTQRAIDRIEGYHKNQGSPSGIATGFPDLDRLTHGLQLGEMSIIAARPSCGKTSLAMNIVEHVALERREPVGVISMETPGDRLVERMIFSSGKVSRQKIVDGEMSERDFEKMAWAAGRVSSSNIHIIDIASMSILEIKSKARRLHQRYGVKLFVVDYLQLASATSKKAQDSKRLEVGEISRGLKCIAMELNVHVLALSQLNRELERDSKRKPRLSDLRESGDLEQDGDLIMLLYRPAIEGVPPDPNSTEPYQVNAIIAKQRNGPTGEVPFMFFKEFTRFESIARERF